MGRFPLGVMSPQIQGSLGGSCDALNFYCTTYNNSYGLSDIPTGGFSHRSAGLSHRRTGYQSNLRPAVYYSPSLDRLDNPNMGLMLRNNYTSITNRDFGPLKVPTGTEPLPYTLHPPNSGYHKSSEITNPKFRAGPAFMSTEYKSRFTPGNGHRPGFPRSAVVGPTENSGFTEGLNLEIINYDPYSQHRAPKGYHRMMGQSMTKTDFLPLTTLQGRELLPALAKKAERDSGFTREANTVLSVNTPHGTQPGDNGNRQNLDMLGQVSVGIKEPSGYSQNNFLYVQPQQQPPQQYLTNYNMRFTDPKPVGKDREGWTRGGIQKQHFSGFSLNNEDHVPGI
ncbi:protein phosphatase 1 regulatory subunit 32 isoform X2 [Xenopus tropicalis]|uniref:Protein phosphatase 1 regulatory subunit 32 isoform X2 n=1 Tax=Xenopus tropicalis TaxID=8364 RepID=A0A8J0SMN8_XENTR|nr:protein phosphatase 1 regulatory subunit 32 isoform X2 [Xenopus tropicalis]|eukprot:XP_012817586.1 PREDICTED: protein phosphatase 1 regulatory subunit 32 isoform X2 [Xenopus tropicalis]